jgi:hypothetical protein
MNIEEAYRQFAAMNAGLAYELSARLSASGLGWAAMESPIDGITYKVEITRLSDNIHSREFAERLTRKRQAARERAIESHWDDFRKGYP